MLASLVLFALLIVATVTDLRYRKIPNATTYPGIVAALALSFAATALAWETVATHDGRVALVPMSDAAVGFLVIGSVMLVCYVSFPGGVGGGDVKLLAMIGAFLGLYDGLEALLWTFLFGGCQAALVWIWREGAVTVVRRAARGIWSVLRWGSSPQGVTGEATAGTMLFLSPSALAAVLLVRFFR